MNPLRWAELALDRASSHYRDPASPDELRSWLGRDVSDASVEAVTRFSEADDGEALLDAVSKLDLDKDEIAQALDVADDSVSVLMHQDKTPGHFKVRYIPDVIESAHPNGTIYMCKSVNGKKAMIAWDLDPDNVIVKVDQDYSVFEPLGWEKLKDFPYSPRQIRDQYGDRLSDEVLGQIGAQVNAGNSKAAGSTSVETLTVSAGRRSHQRSNHPADEIKEQLTDEGKLEPGVSRLILFPTGTERNLSEHWWIAGNYDGPTSVAVANCNKSTYKYLSDCEEVWHINDYIDAAEEYTVQTSDGKMDAGDVPDDVVVYTASSEMYPHLADVVERLPSVLSDVAEGKYGAPDIDSSDTVVVLDSERAFRARPTLRSSDRVVCTDREVRGLGTSAVEIGDEYIVYGKTRLPEWDWDSPELSSLENSCYRMDMNDGGYELIETLGKLHDSGEKLYSQDNA